MIHPWQRNAWEQLSGRLRHGNLPHALLLTGPEGCGKTDLARELVALVLCLEPEDRACGRCRSCLLLAGGAHPDRFEVVPEEGKSQIVVGQVRQLGEKLALTTTVSPRKALLLYPAEAMNPSAGNALLKNLEEPPGDTVMILVSHDASRLPVTVRSRCQTTALAVPERSEALRWLESHTGQNAHDGERALAACGGSPLRAARMLEDGTLRDLTELQAGLRRLLARPTGLTQFAAELMELEPLMAWNWLSICAASAARAALTGDKPDWLAGAGNVLDPRGLSELQRRADRNRALAATSVRQDLLLQEWLLEWAGQSVGAA